MQFTREVLLRGKNLAGAEEGVRFWIHHQQTQLVSSCLDGGHHLRVLQALHRNAVHLKRNADTGESGRADGDVGAPWTDGLTDGREKIKDVASEEKPIQPLGGEK